MCMISSTSDLYVVPKWIAKLFSKVLMHDSFGSTKISRQGIRYPYSTVESTSKSYSFEHSMVRVLVTERKSNSNGG